MTLAPATTDPRELALLKAVGLDRVAPEQRELALHIARQYGLDLMLRHIVMIDGKPYITRDALLFIAHRSGQFDGIQTTIPEVVGDEWRCQATVWRKDMSHPFTYGGRYPTKGGNQKFAPEMAIKVAESMALRRAFNVSAPVAEERWDTEVPAPDPVKPPTLAERAAQKAAETRPEAPRAAETPEVVSGSIDEPEDRPEAPTVAAFTEVEAPKAGGCGWKLELKGGEVVPCTLRDEHPGEHTFVDAAIKTGGKVVRP